MKSLLIVSCAVAIACGGSSAQSASSNAPAPSASAATSSTPVDQVDGARAHELVKGGAILVDVRSPDEFAQGHIDGAVNVPLESIASHDFGGKDKPLVLYCRAGHRSKTAAETLQSNGYTQVHLLGAMSAWDSK